MKGPEDKGPTVIAEAAGEKVEEGALDAYLDQEKANGEGPTSEERIAYLKARYAQIKAAYKSLVLQIDEADGRGMKDVGVKLREDARENYKARKWAVKQLRASGETVEDKYVPG